MIKPSHMVKTKPETLPSNPEQARLVFLARHLHDLQSIRFAGVAIAFLQMPLFGHTQQRVQLIIMSLTAVFSIVWYFLSRNWYRTHYGRTRCQATTLPERLSGRLDVQLAIVTGSFIVFLWCEILWTNRHHILIFANLVYTPYIAWPIRILRDRTNLPERRRVSSFASIAWSAAVCAATTGQCILMLQAILQGWFGRTLLRQFQFDLLAVFGAILLACWLYDAQLLHRTFHETQTQGAA